MQNCNDILRKKDQTNSFYNLDKNYSRGFNNYAMLLKVNVTRIKQKDFE